MHCTLVAEDCEVNDDDDDDDKEYVCNAQIFKQSSNAPLLHYRAGAKSSELPRECLDGRRQSKLDPSNMYKTTVNHHTAGKSSNSNSPCFRHHCRRR